MKAKSVKYHGIGLCRANPDWTMVPHAHVHCEMFVVVKGNHRVEMGGQVFVARGGDVVHIPPNCLHAESHDPKHPTEMYFLGWEEGASVWPPCMIHDIEGRVRMLARWMHQEREDAYGDGAAVQEAYFEAMLAELMALKSRQSEQRWVRATRRFMLDHLAEAIALDDLADQAGMSRFHFVRRYRQASGRTPMQDLRRLRAEAARDMIMTSALPMKAVARRVGISNEYYLSRVFREVFGASPCRDRRLMTQTRGK